MVTIPLDQCKDLYFTRDGMFYVINSDGKLHTALPLRDRTFWVHRSDSNSLRLNFRQTGISVIVTFTGEKHDVDRLVEIIYDYATNYKDPWIDSQFLTDDVSAFAAKNVVCMDNYRRIYQEHEYEPRT